MEGSQLKVRGNSESKFSRLCVSHAKHQHSKVDINAALNRSQGTKTKAKVVVKFLVVLIT